MTNNTDLELGDVEIVGQTVQLLLAREVKGQNHVPRSSIFKVPSAVRDLSPNSYNPRVISIGPLHREATNVQAMEARKPTYLHKLLASLDLPLEKTLEACVQKVSASINRIKESYDEMKYYSHLELAEMMVMDGIFILEFFYHSDLHYLGSLLGCNILNDLVQLENQIPFFVLEDLFECTLKYRQNKSLIEIILNVLKDVNIIKEELIESNKTPDHILDLLHKCYWPKNSIQPRSSSSKRHPAFELDKAGVKFKPIQDPSWRMAIKVERSEFGCFSWSWGKPTLRMPVIRIQDHTELVIRNLIIYEQSAPEVPYYITSYAIALDDLVDTRKDIAMLVESGVLINKLGSNEDAANMINNITKEIISKDFYTEQWDKLDEYYNGYWPKNLARLRRKYFNSPWNIVALVAGIILFGLTIVQTIFTIKGA